MTSSIVVEIIKHIGHSGERPQNRDGMAKLSLAVGRSPGVLAKAKRWVGGGGGIKLGSGIPPWIVPPDVTSLLLGEEGEWSKDKESLFLLVDCVWVGVGPLLFFSRAGMLGQASHFVQAVVLLLHLRVKFMAESIPAKDLNATGV
ncbi:hypothetical protein B296_00050202 [Ensete ventricosum]|uniref:Uncharacterized protein n=1 Tax=Ensete ventricosum TaxID=4639 RepID=A0A426XWX8_ENSVE|nr:hypothetical protein B296_00050202 [Ensete ventricosum]